MRRSDGELFGCNTDYVGAISAIEDGLRGLCCAPLIELFIFAHFFYLKLLRTLLLSFTGRENGSGIVGSPLSGKLFVVIGAGGAGKALAYGAKEKGARVAIANRTYGKILPLICFKQSLFIFFQYTSLSHERLDSSFNSSGLFSGASISYSSMLMSITCYG